jgi:hypothetical protein
MTQPRTRTQDDTIAIFEPPQQNSGIIGGKFLERMEVLNPDSGQKFSAFDFQIGSTVMIGLAFYMRTCVA